MMKNGVYRWLGLLLCLCLLMTAFAGCKTTPAESGGSTPDAPAASTTTQGGTGETTAGTATGDTTGTAGEPGNTTAPSGGTVTTKTTVGNTPTTGKPTASTGGGTTTTTPPKEVKPVEYPYKVVYNSDVTHVIYCVSPYNNARGASVTAEKLDASIKEAADGGADAVSFTPGLCWVPWWPSEVFSAKEYITWFSNYFGGTNAIASDPHYAYAFKDRLGVWGTLRHDIIQEQIDSCRKYGVGAILSYRMNDSHYSNLESSTFTPKIGYTSQVQVEHPEWKQTEGNSFEQSLFDYRIAAYREYRLAMIKELIANYDIDGFEMDFMRWHDIFTTSKTTAEGRLRVMTEFVTEIRAALDAAAAKDGKYRFLIAKIPAWDDAYADMGIDVAAWAKAGVDVFNLTSTTVTAQDTEIAQIKKQVPAGKKVFYEMTCAANYISDNASATYINMGKSIVRRATVEQLYTSAYLAYQQGADGISLFNFMYYRGIPESPNDDRENKNFVNEPPFYAIKNLGNKAFLAGHAQNYFIGREDQRTYRKGWQMPQSLGKGASATFTLKLAQPTGGWTKDGVLRLWSEASMGNATYTVTVNGTEVKPVSDSGEPYKSAYTTGLGTADQRRCYAVPKSLLKSGADNVIKVTQTGGDFTFISYLDLAIQ